MVVTGRHEDGGAVRASQSCPVIGAVAQVLVLGAFAVTIGLGRPGWVVGVVCAVVANGVLANGIAHHRVERLGPAMWVTLARVTLGVAVAALAVEAVAHRPHTALLVGGASTAIVLDAVDGWLARRTATSSELGARFDGEADAFLIVVLSAYVARSVGWWVLAIGLLRYVFLIGEWTLTWMRAQLPARQWRKVVAATQAIVLTVAGADVLPQSVASAAVAGALVLLVESFGRDTWWLWRHRHDAATTTAAAPRWAGRIVATTVGAAAFVWAALLTPDKLSQVAPTDFLRVPMEALVAVAVVAVLPSAVRRVAGGVLGVALALLVVVRILDMGFFATFARPFNPVDDWSYAGIGWETLRDSVGGTRATVALVLAGVVLVGLLVCSVAAVMRLTRVASDHRRTSLRVAGVLAAVAVAGQLVGAPIASTDAARLAVGQVRAVRDGLKDYRAFVRELADDRFHDSSADQLLTDLRGKDVLLVFVESYGESAVHDSSYAPGVAAVLRDGDRRLHAAGFSARSAFLTSPTFGGTSWLAHSTLQSGAWVTDNRRYSHLTTSDRFTLSQAFKRAGWRAVDDVPSNDRTWREGTLFYHYDTVYDRRNVGYRGPTFGYPSMPDQYTLLALHRLELASAHRPPVFAEVDLVSSHIPWTRIPHMIDWDAVGDGSIFHTSPVDESDQSALFNDPSKARAAYGRSIEYSLSAVFAFLARYGTDDTVVVLLGDHQPATIVSGENASHNVPISIIARDPTVLAQIRGWHWQPGVQPATTAPVWRMDVFRDRFLVAFGSRPAL